MILIVVALFHTLPDDATYAVKKQFKSGFQAIKLYDYLDEKTLISAIRAANQLGMYSIGHIPDPIPIKNILESGIDELAHVDEL